MEIKFGDILPEGSGVLAWISWPMRTADEKSTRELGVVIGLVGSELRGLSLVEDVDVDMRDICTAEKVSFRDGVCEILLKAIEELDVI